MKIHSNFKDYYDVGLNHGDDSTEYIRKSQTIKVPDAFKHLFTGVWNTGRSVTNADEQISGRYYLSWIGFCGRMHIALSGYMYTNIIWDDEAINLIEEVINARVNGAPRGYRKYPKSVGHLRKYLRIDQYKSILSTDFTDEFIKLGVPIIGYSSIWYGSGEFVLNPRLSPTGFQKVKDPYTAYQEIDMFCGNQLARQVDPQPLSDKDRLVAHGMDPVWSFRNPGPPTRKAKGKIV